MIYFSSLSKRPGATLAGIFSVAFSSVLLLCGAGFTPTGALQKSDINANGYNLTNAATVSATNVIVSGSLTVPTGFTLPFSKITSAPALGSLAGLSPTGTASSSTYLRGDNAWATVPAGYTLPNATTSTLGGVIVGSGLAVSSGTITVNYGTTSGTALQGNAIGATVEAQSATLDTLAASNPFTAGSNVTITGTWPAITIAASGGGGGFSPPFTPSSDTIALFKNFEGNAIISDDANGNPSLQGYSSTGTVAGDVLGFGSAGTLTLNGVSTNAAGGLAQLASDGSIAFLGTTDSGSYAIAVGASSTASEGGMAVGYSASATDFGCAFGYFASVTGYGVAMGEYASTISGGSVGHGASSTYGGAVGGNSSENGEGGAVGYYASATSGFAGGVITAETGGGANFCGGTYAGTGIAINADEIAVSNGSGFATLTGCINSAAPASSSASGIAGQFAYDSNYFYVCVATNTWVRASLSTW